jgi:hypothetical protein
VRELSLSLLASFSIVAGLVGCGGAAGDGGSAPTTVATGRLNDSGATASQCFEAGSDLLVTCVSAGALALSPVQDGMVGRDATAATTGSADGKLGFSFSSIPGGCVLDQVTGLLWESKATDGGLRDRNKTYSNLTPLSAAYGAATDASGFVAAVNATRLCGASDWRLPTADELQGIADYGVRLGAGPFIDATWFPITQASKFWTSSASAAVSSQAWEVDFVNGSVHPLARTFSFYVRLVRGAPSPLPAGFRVSVDGLQVTDDRTTLVWRRCPEGTTWNGATCSGVASLFTQEAALQQAASQATATGVAWRLPNLKELASLADRSQTAPAIDLAVFPATPPSEFWTSTPVVGDGRIGNYIDFGNGYAGYGYVSAMVRGASLVVRLVRDGPRGGARGGGGGVRGGGGGRALARRRPASRPVPYFVADWCSAKAAPCGSWSWAIRPPPGTSIGPLRTFAPLAVARRTAASRSLVSV